MRSDSKNYLVLHRENVFFLLWLTEKCTFIWLDSKVWSNLLLCIDLTNFHYRWEIMMVTRWFKVKTNHFAVEALKPCSYLGHNLVATSGDKKLGLDCLMGDYDTKDKLCSSREYPYPIHGRNLMQVSLLLRISNFWTQK